MALGRRLIISNCLCGTDAVPDEWQQRYKDWVIVPNTQELAPSVITGQTQSDDFHKELQEQEPKHLFQQPQHLI